MRSKGLTLQQNEAARRLLQGLIDHKYGTRTHAAKDLGVSQATVSDFLNGKKQLGEKLLVGLMRAASGMSAIVENHGRRKNTEPPLTAPMASATLPTMPFDEGNKGPKHKTTIKSLTTGQRGPDIYPPPLPEPAVDEYYTGRLKLHAKRQQAAQREAVDLLVEHNGLTKLAAFELVTSLEPPPEPTGEAYYVAAIRALKKGRRKKVQ